MLILLSISFQNVTPSPPDPESRGAKPLVTTELPLPDHLPNPTPSLNSCSLQ
ncbi:hypothetical protein N657DRAFT_647718 [Parathielavia appendiculata]|uniref:Uncharacterized protein n=1 Tax=Parathielavia appendiculata TaxID=2587402 RepID=A0AAN6Z1I3_9PEZI|nr:hypothetical protein N657DRAFT_647718 [Parathielavia appendiculata]